MPKRGKKLLAAGMALTLVASLCACQSTPTANEEAETKGIYIPGEYTQSSPGFGGDVTVTVTVDSENITDVKITGEGETPEVGGRAIEEMPQMIMEANSAEVDGVAGATYTSTAIIKALEKCLAQARGEEESESAQMKAGTYTATAKGFYGDFDVTVSVDDSKILSVEVGENPETPSVGGKAIEILKEDVVNENTAGVDAVTGATLTSRAMLNAVTECLEQAQAPQALFDKVEYQAQEVSKEADVVVVGSGAAGLSSAILAAETGANVILIEKQGILGGSTLLSAGIVYAAMNDEDVPVMVDYYQQRAEGKADQEMVEFFAKNSINTIHWLNDMGVQWFMNAPAGTAPEPRANFAADFTGASIVNPLIDHAKEAGVEIITNCKGTDIVMNDGKVVGLKAEGKGIAYTFNTKAVILATGGFDASEEMKAEHSPIAVGDFPLSNKGNVGEGIKMGEAVGAATEFKGGIIGFNIVDGSLPNSGYSNLAMAAGVFVGEDGGFVTENIDYPVTHTAMKKSGYENFYGIVDAAGQDNGELAISLGYGYKADSIEELAKTCGMDADKLKEAVSHNEALTTAPYYAIVAKPATIGSMGGLKINTDAEVLDENAQAIPGLYAAGEVANSGLYYQEYPASGTSNCMGLTFGMQAGRNAALYATK